jgi:hypothetical protein
MIENNSLSTVKGSMSAIALIRAEFPDVTLAGIKKLTETDRHQLASSIALNRGLEAEQLAFIPVVY